MFNRDESLIRTIQSDRVQATAHPELAVPAQAPAAHDGGLRRTIGRGLVRLGAWVAADRPESLLRFSA